MGRFVEESNSENLTNLLVYIPLQYLPSSIKENFDNDTRGILTDIQEIDSNRKIYLFL